MLLRYYHTLRHLRLTQVTGRIRHRLSRPKPDLRDAPPLRPVGGFWNRHAWREPSMLGPSRFLLLNQERELVFPAAWNAPDLEKLWIYNLHYFDDLNAKGADTRQSWHTSLIKQWIKENPPGIGNGWEPYPLSLRIVNWIKWVQSGNELCPAAIQNLAVQVRYLSRRLEFHLLGNHLFENAKTLVFAGLFFSGEEADAWFHTGMSLLSKQLDEQVLADGGHFELSPMYHGLILEGMIDLFNLFHTYQIDPPDDWHGVVSGMRDWLACMCHPDGDISFFNDAAFGIAPPLAALEQYAAGFGLANKRAAAGSRLLESSGYARLEQGDAVVLADVAAIGPSYLPGHAHADSLSFEMSLRGRRVLVNSGTSVYGVGLERQRQRGTAAHNTLQIDGADSSEVWSGFRVARRALVRVERFDTSCGIKLAASHDGYQRLAGRPVHRRVWAMNAKELVVSDTIEGSGLHNVCVRFYFHPDYQILPQGPDTYAVTTLDKSVVLHLLVDTKMRWQIEKTAWYPGFGLRESNLCLKASYEGALPMQVVTKLVWQD